MFIKQLSDLIRESANNFYTDNYDFFRFGHPERDVVPADINVNFEAVKPYLMRLDNFHNLLEDERSKELLTLLIAFRIMGHRRIKLPLSIPEYWQTLELIEKIPDKNDFVDPGFLGWRLEAADLKVIDYPVKIYTLPAAVLCNFYLKQYEYFIEPGRGIKAETGDYVIDAGGCWGDTALYFANEAGENGKVFSFEFIPKNLDIFKKNLALNEELSKRIEIIDKPIWDKSSVPVFYEDNGPASRVSFEQTPHATGRTETISIDDFVKQNGIEKVDFIKMDIEGAEMPALRGALEVITKHKPKLALAVYHSMEDLSGIAEYINSLKLGYKFYLGHFTIHHEETVLFCKAN